MWGDNERRAWRYFGLNRKPMAPRRYTKHEELERWELEAIARYDKWHAGRVFYWVAMEDWARSQIMPARGHKRPALWKQEGDFE